MKAPDYTFELSPRSKTRYNAGPYDPQIHTPRYTIEVLLPEHVKHQLEMKQFLMGKEGSHLWVWDLENKSTWPAFISIKKDGVLVSGRSGT